MSRNKFYLILLCLVSYSAFSQKSIEPNSNDKLEAKSLKEKYEDDHIALQLSKDYISFGFDQKTNKVTVNHKLDENHINLDSRADIQKYCFYDGESEITEFSIKYKNKKKAGFQVIDEAYTSEDLFHIDTRVKYANVDFPLNGYKYYTTIRKEYKDIKYFTKVYFNNSYPTVKREIKFDIPSWLDIELKEMNFEGYDIKKTEYKDSKTKNTIVTYKIEDLPAMYDEERAPGPTYIYPHILILAKSQSKNGDKEAIFNSTQDLYNWYSSLANSLENDRTPFKAKVAELTKDAKTDDEKIKNIYYWVQDNIRYIAFEDGIAGFKPDEAANVYNKKYGDCKGMANLTKQMLIEAGFDARLTWIGTKRIAYDYSTPNLSVDNHMICTLFKDGKAIFLDGTEKFNAYGEYADRIQGKQVLIEDGEKYILKTVPSANHSENKEYIAYNYTLDGETLKGSVQKTYNGESRASLLYYFSSLKTDIKEEFLKSYLEKGDSNIKVSNIVASDVTDREASLNFTADITVNNAVSSFDGEVYIDLDIEKELSDFEFNDRKTDYIFRHKKDLDSKITLQIPAGYKVTYVPENKTISKDNFDLSITFKQEENAVVCKKSFVIKNAKVETSDFDEWNTFIKKLDDTYKEQIILTKQ